MFEQVREEVLGIVEKMSYPTTRASAFTSSERAAVARPPRR